MVEASRVTAKVPVKFVVKARPAQRSAGELRPAWVAAQVAVDPARVRRAFEAGVLVAGKAALERAAPLLGKWVAWITRL